MAALNPWGLTGQKTKLRPIAASDYQPAYDVFSLECVTKNLAYWLHSLPSEYLKNKIAKSRWKNGWNAGLAIENEHCKFIGWIGFNAPSQGMKHDMGLGYALHPDHWGNGYMSDAVDALTHYLFQRYPIEKITTYANLDNIGSQRVLKKCGFQNVGEEDQKSPARGTIGRVYRFDALARNTNACRLVPARVLTYATKRIELEA
jgi:RimJ/RimL family protein N-acetyltransferase